MALRVLGDPLYSQKDLSGAVCIVGAGIAGLIAATRIARNKQLRVVLLESGLRHFDSVIGGLNQIENFTGNYNGALQTRARALGGTSLLWAGKLLPLSRHDMMPRPYLGVPGWPFDRAELEPYRQEIEAFMGVDGESHEEAISERLDPRSLLIRNDVDFSLRWPKRPTAKRHNLAYVFRKEIEKCQNLEIWLGATVSGFECDPGSGRIRALTARTPSGRSVRVHAREYLIAAGTLESTRLLLWADRQSNHVISSSGDALGRYFNDHFGLDAAVLRPLDPRATNRILSDRLIHASMRHLHFELRSTAQEQSGIGSSYFDIGVENPSSSAIESCKKILNSLKRKRLDVDYEALKTIFKDAPSLWRSVQWRWAINQRYWPPDATLPLKIWVEQLSQWKNRISLSEQRDAMQVPLLKVDLTKTDAEEKTFQVMVEKIERYWKQNFEHVCRLEWKAEIRHPEHRIVDSALDQAHPAGSTRMGTNAAESVVDGDLRVHKIANLSVASASVFPTSGSANPTFTIMQLAMRASDALTRRL